MTMEEPASWRSEPCCMGIDEAGRGPVIGPMVYACAVVACTSKDSIGSRGFDDSKALTEEKREKLFKLIKEDSQFSSATDILSAREISGKMLARGKTSLNVLAEEATCRLIQGYLDQGFQLQEVFIDTVGDPDRYQARLSQRFPGINFTVCPKADSLYPIVSAASIVAKVTRDHAIMDIEASLVAADGASNEGEGVRPCKRVKLGSGYPGDPDTKAWLQRNLDKVFGYPDFVRFSWDTCTRVLDSVCVPIKWECEAAEGGEAGQTRLPFANRANPAAVAETSAANRHSYFRTRRLQPAMAF